MTNELITEKYILVEYSVENCFSLKFTNTFSFIHRPMDTFVQKSAVEERSSSNATSHICGNGFALGAHVRRKDAVN